MYQINPIPYKNWVKLGTYKVHFFKVSRATKAARMRRDREMPVGNLQHTRKAIKPVRVPSHASYLSGQWVPSSAEEL